MIDRPPDVITSSAPVHLTSYSEWLHIARNQPTVASSKNGPPRPSSVISVGPLNARAGWLSPVDREYRSRRVLPSYTQPPDVPSCRRWMRTFKPAFKALQRMLADAAPPTRTAADKSHRVHNSSPAAEALTSCVGTSDR